MTEEQERKTEMKKAIQTAQETAITAENLQKGIQDDIKNKKQMCSYLQGIHDYSQQKAQMYEAFLPYVSAIGQNGWEQAQGSIRFDATQLIPLQQLHTEIKDMEQKQNEIKGTICSGNIAIQSSTVTVPLIFQAVVPQQIMVQVIKGIKDLTQEHINDISTRLLQDYPRTVEAEFHRIIDGWNSSDFKGKPEILNHFRNFIMNRLWEELDPCHLEYKATLWYIRYKDKPYKEQFTKARFFILGHRDESTLQESTLNEIDSVCEETTNCYHFSSIIGHLKENEIHLMDKCYKDMISNLRLILMLRKQNHQ
jgi:hypothetical protein